VAEAVRVAHLESPGPILTEVSGGVRLDSVGAYAAAGPDRISVGALTHSAPVLDLGLDLVWTSANDRNEGKN
jgi:nicotinate-nucleotide pyrophosphorylase (carboxylating)